MGTRFYFSVSADTLLETLPRFAAFFHCPLFSPSAVTREVNAVNAEYLGKRQDDDWRVAQLERHLSSDGHIWRKFGTGNTQTLLGPDVQEPTSAEAPMAVDSSDDTAQTPCSEAGLELRRRVMDWWSTYYCANRMCLAVLGKGKCKGDAPVLQHAKFPFRVVGRSVKCCSSALLTSEKSRIATNCAYTRTSIGTREMRGQLCLTSS